MDINAIIDKVSIDFGHLFVLVLVRYLLHRYIQSNTIHLYVSMYRRPS